MSNVHGRQCTHVHMSNVHMSTCPMYTWRRRVWNMQTCGYADMWTCGNRMVVWRHNRQKFQAPGKIHMNFPTKNLSRKKPVETHITEGLPGTFPIEKRYLPRKRSQAVEPDCRSADPNGRIDSPACPGPPYARANCARAATAPKGKGSQSPVVWTGFPASSADPRATG